MVFGTSRNSPLLPIHWILPARRRRHCAGQSVISLKMLPASWTSNSSPLHTDSRKGRMQHSEI
ncbi:hypothetical protein DPMN_084951 [Dreissena polymorpha]|uniref:Uncharacterized protein n=1 Tax=Dreissena polymorpha TaxID=45954 RepID=A0A9D4BJV5_DREPO|nr:hypothetical protein DPMN_084951 [Dreissena polymorpha]